MRNKDIGGYIVRGCLGGIYLTFASIGTVLFLSGLGFWVIADVIERTEQPDYEVDYEVI